MKNEQQIVGKVFTLMALHFDRFNVEPCCWKGPRSSWLFMVAAKLQAFCADSLILPMLLTINLHRVLH